MCCGIYRLTNRSICQSVQRALSPKGNSELSPGISKGTVAAVEPGHQGQCWEQGSAGLAQGGLAQLLMQGSALWGHSRSRENCCILLGSCLQLDTGSRAGRAWAGGWRAVAPAGAPGGQQNRAERQEGLEGAPTQHPRTLLCPLSVRRSVEEQTAFLWLLSKATVLYISIQTRFKKKFFDQSELYSLIFPCFKLVGSWNSFTDFKLKEIK